MKQLKRHIDVDVSIFDNDPAADMTALYESTLKDFVEGSIVAGKVLEVRSNEVLVDIGYKSEGVVSGAEFDDLADVVKGDPLQVLLEQIEDEDGMVVLSRKKAEEKITWENVLANCEEGGIINGRIKNIVKGGFIVDIQGVDAFLPGSQVDVLPVHNPDSYLGLTEEFKVLKINQERRNIVLSRRELIEERRRNRKKALLKEIEVGQWRKGVVKNITDFGVFVDLDGMDGLLHITDMSWGRINHPSEMATVGDDIEVVILDVNLERERVSLGLKQKTPNPWDQIDEKYPAGSRLRGKVVNLVPYGAFVELEEGVEGLVHVSEISWTKRIVRASDVLALGQEVDVVVLALNREDRKIALGIRQTEANPWEMVRDRYPIGTRITGRVRNFTSYGAFVELHEGVDGMIHVSDMSWTRKINHPSDVLKKGEEVDAIVLEVDPGNQRISLGLKQAQEDPWSTIASRYSVGQRVSGKVSKLTSFGAFVELEEGIDGLVHISQLSEERVEKVKDVVEPGQEVEARIVRIDPVERRIGLSIKASQLDDEDFVLEDDMLEGLRPGDELVDLAGAFDEAFGVGDEDAWHPGERDDDKASAKKDDDKPSDG